MIKSTVLQMFWRFLLPQRPACGGQQSSERGVVTTSGAPREGSFLYLLGRKGTFDDDKTFIESDYQFSPF